MILSLWFSKCKINTFFLKKLYEHYNYSEILLDNVNFILPQNTVKPCYCINCNGYFSCIVLNTNNEIFINELLKLYPDYIECKLTDRNSNFYLNINSYVPIFCVYRYTFLHPNLSVHDLYKIYTLLKIKLKNCILYTTNVINILNNFENKTLIKIHIIIKNNINNYYQELDYISNIIKHVSKCLPYHFHTSYIFNNIKKYS